VKVRPLDVGHVVEGYAGCPLPVRFSRLHCQPLGNSRGAIREYPIAPYAPYAGLIPKAPRTLRWAWALADR
jgi:hypothetical protein